MTAATEAPAVSLPSLPTGTAWRRRAVLLAPLLLVNTVAVYGQYSWALGSLDDPGLTLDVRGITIHLLPALFAGAVESVALYLQHEANVARLAGDAVAKLAAASYGIAGIAALLNFLHWHDRNLSAAIAFGLLSAISPWLWGIRSRSEHREQLRRRGLVEERAVKFSTARWLLFPGPTFRALRLAVWAGVQNPQEAVALLEGQLAAEDQGQQDQGQEDEGHDEEGQVQGQGHDGALGPDGDQGDSVVAWVSQELALRPRPTRADVIRRGAARFEVSESTMKRRYSEATKPRLLRRAVG